MNDYVLSDSCDSDKIYFSTDFTQRDHLTQEEQTFFILKPKEEEEDD